MIRCSLWPLSPFSHAGSYISMELTHYLRSLILYCALIERMYVPLYTTRDSHLHWSCPLCSEHVVPQNIKVYDAISSHLNNCRRFLGDTSLPVEKWVVVNVKEGYSICWYNKIKHLHKVLLLCYSKSQSFL